MQLILLGMHRSGAAAVTRIINLMGARLGTSSDMIAASSCNSKGYWQRADITRLNEAILNSHDASADNTHSLCSAELLPSRCEREVAEMADVISALDIERPWILRDPRLCLTLPVLLPLLEAPVFVLIHREPLAIARSLRNCQASRTNAMQLLPSETALNSIADQSANEPDTAYYLALWEKYMTDALKHSAGQARRLIVSYDQLIADPMRTVNRLHTELFRLGTSGLRKLSLDEITACIDPSLRHHHVYPSQQHDYLNPRQQYLAKGLSDRTVLSGAPPELSPDAHDVLQRYAENRISDQADSALQISTAKKELDRCQRDLEQVNERSRQIFWLFESLEKEVTAVFESMTWKAGSIFRKGVLVATFCRESRITKDDIEEIFATARQLSPDWSWSSSPSAFGHFDQRSAIAPTERLAQCQRSLQVAISQNNQQLALLGSLEDQVSAVFNSMTWKVGTFFRRFILAVTFRREERITRDDIEELFARSKHLSFD
ncbi:hypothetical protein CKO42_08900 [Lamprobacter modestohalophilus]|uniref:Sulfotransferase family protein n=1 Tax=Lamprobacter modestohalophilus TaxID=1064514 RepID=A0A9X1B3K1_9GAMM|nr:sulfotransferase [Lamprobacter modestohalophilus]MBK1618553.1 hypothetical protein [Lamprobacter modestohalophilus]